MTNSKSTKRALLTSALALVVCVAMLIGTTFAWFTDTASTAVNKIQAGKLDVALEMQNADGTWENAEGKSLQFKVNGPQTDNQQILWEPGCTYNLQPVRVKNDGNLAIKYKVIIGGATGDTKLLDVIKFDAYVSYDAQPESAMFNDIMSEGEITSGNLEKNGDTATIYISAHMDEAAGNEYQNLSLENIAITVLATQHTYENDSIDDQYDRYAQYPDVTMIKKDNDKTASQVAEEVLSQNEETIKAALAEDVTFDVRAWEEKPMGGDKTKVITIDGQGHKLTFNNTNSNWNNVVFSNAKLIIKNAVIDNSGYNADGGTWDSHDITFRGNVEFQNVTFTNAVAIDGTAVLKDVTISDETATQDTYMLWICAGSDVTLENVTINGKSAVGYKNRAIAIKDEYVKNPGMTKLTFKGYNNVITSDKKAAVVVSSKGGTKIFVEQPVDIEGVVDDKENLVWKDASTEYADSVVDVEGANKITKS